MLKIQRNHGELWEFPVSFANYSINLNLFQNIKIIFNEGDIETVLRQTQSWNNVSSALHTTRNVNEVFSIEGKWLLLEGKTSVPTYTHTHRGIRSGKYMG